MKERYAFVVSICIMALFLLNNCEGNNSSGLITQSTTTQGADQGTPAVITTSGDGAAAASTVLQSKELVVASTNIFRDLGLIARSYMASAVTGTGTGTCADYGTYNYNTTYISTSGKYSILLTFNLCRQNGFQYDGNYMASGTSDLFTGRLVGLKILNFQNDYTTLISSLTGVSLSYTMQGSGIASNATYTFTANGGLQAFDYYSLGQHTMNMNKLVTNYSVDTNNATNIQTTSLTANGTYSVKWTTNKTTLTYSDFKIDIQKQLANATEDISMAGRVAADYTLSSDFGGIFDVATTTPIRSVVAPYPPKTTQGSFTINNAATARYGTTDTVAVSVPGDAPVSYAKEFMLMKKSDFYAMEQQLPIVSGQTGTASGNIMSISALSTGSTSTDLDCYTDVHVNYYSKTGPTASDALLWYVDWHTSLSSCVTSTSIPFQQGTSSTGVSTDHCDVGLDINGAATDITSGGVEHFLAANLPAGYYVLSINNYSCATTVTNAATLLIGDYLFGPYHCSYTRSDGESGHVLGAWCRLIDIRVNVDKTVDVMTPDLSLAPWHP